MPTTKLNTSARGVILTIFAGICWGFSGACGQYLFTNYNTNTAWLTSIRMMGAGVILLIVGLLRQRKKMTGIWASRQDILQLLLFAICGLVCSQYTYLAAISYTNAGTATVLQYLGPVLIMVYVCIRTKTPPTKKEIVAIVLALSGTFLLATHGKPGSLALSTKGLVWGLLSALTVLLYTLLPGRLISRWGSLSVTGFGMLIGGVVLSLIMRIWTIPVHMDFHGLLALGGIILIGTVFAYTMYLQGINEVGAVRGSMLASVEPVSAALFSAFWLHTSFVWIDILGFACILTTVFLLAKKNR
jgi:drug/metabolite transporter (DMT)-like permease